MQQKISWRKVLCVSSLMSAVYFQGSTRAQTPERVWNDRVDEGRDLLATNPQAGQALLNAEIARLEAAFAARTYDADSIYRAGMAYYYLGNLDKAQASFAKAIRLQPENSGYHFMAGRIHVLTKRWVQAKLSLEECVKLDPKLVVGWMQLGRVYIELQQADNACKAYEMATTLTPDDPKAHARLGEARMVKDERSPDAIASLRRAIELDPADSISWYNLGQVHQNRREPDEALKAFAEVAKLRPEDWRAKAKLVQCHAALGDVASRDAGIAELKSLHAAGKIQAELFCREQFAHNETPVMAFEYFKPSGERAVRFSFRVLDEKGETKYRVSLGSYDATTEAARAAGEIAADARIWHLDGYYPNDEHRTFGMFKAELSYEQTREMVIDVLDGKLQTISSTTRSSDGPTVEVTVPK